MTTQDVYFLALHEPYQSADHPVPINATIVHAKTLLHRGVPQPTGGLMYRCLTEFPGRFPGCVVPLSTLTFELNGGEGWEQIGSWEAVVAAVVQLARQGACDAMPMGLPLDMAVVLAHGPVTELTVNAPGRPSTRVGAADRRYHLDQLTNAVRGFAAQGPFWPGDDLVDPPRQPAVLPYQPYSPG